MDHTKCADCRQQDFVEFQGDLTCCHCGLVAAERMMTDEPEWRSFAQEFTSYGGNDNSRVGAHDGHMQTFIQNGGKLSRLNMALIPRLQHSISCQDLFEKMQITLNTSDHVTQTARDMFNKYNEATKISIKSDEKRRALAGACIFYACKTVLGGARSREDICHPIGIHISVFHKACTRISDVLLTLPGYRDLAMSGAGVDDTRLKMIRSVYGIDPVHHHKVRQTVDKLYAKVQLDPDIRLMDTEKLNATLIYMACMFLKLQITMKVVAECCGASSTTIINIEKIVKRILVAPSCPAT